MKRRQLTLTSHPNPKARLLSALTALLFLVSGRMLTYASEPSHPWLTGYEGSQTCTLCHPTTAHEVMGTTHWTWEHVDAESGQRLGKRNMINNYCISLPSNEPRCTSCHVGWGYSNSNFNFNDATKVDCLVCHDTTGTYKKFPAGSGLPVIGNPREFPAGSGIMWQPVDLALVAQNVGRPSRSNCGACHFYAGGGDAVKHGDLDSSMANPSRDLDVHMGGAWDMQCTTCHTTSAHRISGSRFSKDHTDNQTCERCHTAAPHARTNTVLDQHTTRIACQTCHIPAFARGAKATKMLWDWSTAGQRGPNGRNMIITNATGEVIYDTQKGTFAWERNVVPEYAWFDGGVNYVSLDTPVDANQTLAMNRLRGSIDSPGARIFPIKKFVGRQPFDAAVNRLAMPHLFPTSATDTNAYWRVFDWNRALTAGMEYTGRTFSGDIGWVDTEMVRIMNHMVAPKAQALSCTSCHVPGGRLNFAALGYAQERANQLQNMFGFEISFTQFSPEGRSFQIKCAGAPGRRYRLQFSTDLRGWTELAESERQTGETECEHTWTESAEGANAARFYRIVRLADQP